MKNKIHHTSKEKIRREKESLLQDSAVFLAELDGGAVRSLQDYLSIMGQKFQFPFAAKCLNGYLDWMRDLSWLGKDKYVFILYNFEAFLENDPPLKKELIRLFSDTILPWWQEEVRRYCVGGKEKPFDVYLVD